MPICTSIPVCPPTRDEYYRLDRLVTGLAYGIHNGIGKLLDESVYQVELARRCLRDGIPATREMRITVSHGCFSRDYFIDLLLASGVVVETKTVQHLLPQHRSQVLHYLFLTSLPHATMLNFRTPRVQHEYVSTTHTYASRHVLKVHAERWKCLCPNMVGIEGILIDLIEDWGACLDISLYRDAAVHILNGSLQEPQSVDIAADGVVIGHHKMHLLAEGIGFVLTSTKGTTQTESHLLRLLAHTNLQAIAWANLHQTSIHFVTLQRPCS